MNSHQQCRIEQLSQWFERLLCRIRVARAVRGARVLRLTAAAGPQ